MGEAQDRRRVRHRWLKQHPPLHSQDHSLSRIDPDGPGGLAQAVTDLWSLPAPAKAFESVGVLCGRPEVRFSFAAPQNVCFQR
jgi:hypothetical protein